LRPRCRTRLRCRRGRRLAWYSSLRPREALHSWLCSGGFVSSNMTASLVRDRSSTAGSSLANNLAPFCGHRRSARTRLPWWQQASSDQIQVGECALLRLGVARLRLVPGRGRRIDDRPGPRQQPLLLEQSAHQGEDLLAQPVPLQRVAKLIDRARRKEDARRGAGGAREEIRAVTPGTSARPSKTVRAGCLYPRRSRPRRRGSPERSLPRRAPSASSPPPAPAA